MEAYGDHVEFEAVEFPLFAFEFDTNSAHFFRGDALVGNMFVEDIDDGLADIHSDEELGVSSDLPRKEPCVTGT